MVDDDAYSDDQIPRLVVEYTPGKAIIMQRAFTDHVDVDSEQVAQFGHQDAHLAQVGVREKGDSAASMA